MDYTDVLKDVKKILIKTGKYQLEKFHSRDFGYDTKSTIVDLITEVDLESERMILNYLQSKYPDVSSLSEERGETSVLGDFRWILDPLDGTTNFAQGLPIFTISIALMKFY